MPRERNSLIVKYFVVDDANGIRCMNGNCNGKALVLHSGNLERHLKCHPELLQDYLSKKEVQRLKKANMVKMQTNVNKKNFEMALVDLFTKNGCPLEMADDPAFQMMVEPVYSALDMKISAKKVKNMIAAHEKTSTTNTAGDSASKSSSVINSDIIDIASTLCHNVESNIASTSSSSIDIDTMEPDDPLTSSSEVKKCVEEQVSKLKETTDKQISGLRRDLKICTARLATYRSRWFAFQSMNFLPTNSKAKRQQKDAVQPVQTNEADKNLQNENDFNNENEFIDCDPPERKVFDPEFEQNVNSFVVRNEALEHPAQSLNLADETSQFTRSDVSFSSQNTTLPIKMNNNEFEVFGQSIAVQLSTMKYEYALELQLEIQELVTRKRLTILRNNLS